MNRVIVMTVNTAVDCLESGANDKYFQINQPFTVSSYKNLQMRRVSSIWVPNLLTCEQMVTHIEIYDEWLEAAVESDNVRLKLCTLF